MKRFVALVMALCLAITPIGVFAEEGTTDVLDNSAELAQVEEIGIPTEAMVEEMKVKADALYKDGKYEEAIEAYYEATQKANYLANIFSQCCEPFYNNPDSAKSIPRDLIEVLAKLEKRANDFKQIRNTCYVYQGLSYSKNGNKEMALAVLYNALNIVDVSQTRTWKLARDEMLEIIEYSGK